MSIAVIIFSCVVDLLLIAVALRLAKKCTTLERESKAARALVDLIDELRAPEGWMVSLYCDNPDFNNGPNVIVDVYGEWWDADDRWHWVERRFSGDTVYGCLVAAKTERDRQSQRHTASALV